MIDRELIENIFRKMDLYVNHLRQLGQVSRAKFLADMTISSAAKYNLHIAIECCIDIAHHIIARQGLRPPESYADSFHVLAENGIIEKSLAVTAESMVRMRNLLVHLYMTVDDSQVYDTINGNLGDFDRFKAAIYKYLQQVSP